MCRPASMVLTKDAVLWSRRSESHEDIIREYELHADGVGGPNLLRVELTPAGNDYRLPLDEWAFRCDQDIMPPWFDAEPDVARARNALPDWLAAKVVLPGEVREHVDNAHIVAAYGTIQSMYGSSVVEYMYGSSVVQSMHGSSVVKYMTGSSVVKYMTGSSVVKSMIGSSVVKSMIGSSVVERMYDSSVVKYMTDSSVVQSMYGSSVVESMYGSSVVQRMYGSSVVESMYGSSVVEYMTGSSVVKSMYGSSVVTRIYPPVSPDILKSSEAVLIDRSGDKVVYYVGKDEGGE